MTAAGLTVLGLLAGAAPAASAAVPAGPVTAWGYGPSVSVPASVVASGATAIAAGDYHSLALTPHGQVVAWGDDELGQTDVPPSLAGRTTTAISAAGDHSLALTSDGQVTAWGDNSYGQAEVPASLSGTTVTAIAAGYLHNLALTSAGRIVAWGNGDEGATDVPASLTGKTVTGIAAGGQSNLALTSDGHVTAWGWNVNGQTDVPTTLAGKRVTAIAASNTHDLALTSDGRLTAWGDNEYGQGRVPTSLSGKTVTAISASTFNNLVLTSDGQVVAWGNNDYEQAEVPASLTGRTVIAVAAGYLSSTVLTRAVAPAVISSPASANVRLGASASFTAVATGDPAPTVQWQRAEHGRAFVDLPGATSSRYTVTPVRADDGATFRAVFTSSAGTATSGAATLTLVNGSPTASDVSIAAAFESATPVTLSGTDPDGDTLTYAVARQPNHGTLSGQAPRLTYTPADGYSGGDSFTYRANDGSSSSRPGRVTVTVAAQSCLPTTPTQAFRVSADERDTDGVVRSPRLTTSRSGELLVALVAANGPARGGQAVTGLTGGGLTWTLVQRDDVTRGTSEVWQAYAAKKLTPTRVTAHVAVRGYAVGVTVAGFDGARPAVGSSTHAAGSRSTPQVQLTPQTSGSVVWAVGRAVGSRYEPKPVTGQKIVHHHTSKAPRTGFWTQRVTAPSTGGKAVTVADRAAAGTWGYAAVEIRGTCR